MPHEYLSEEQTARYGRFVDAPSPGELEEFFRMDTATLEHVRSKRRPHHRLGWSVQWGTVRMLGTFLSEPADVPEAVVEFMAEQVGVDDPGCIKDYPGRLPTQHEHAREIRERLGYRDFTEGEMELRAYVASRVWNSVESRRALFDRAVVWLIRHRVLLPGISVLSRLVAGVRSGEYDRIYTLTAQAPPSELRATLVGLLDVPDDRYVSELERMRTGITQISGKGMKTALDRLRRLAGPGYWIGGRVAGDRGEAGRDGPLRAGVQGSDHQGPVPDRCAATMLATVRHLECASIDDALALFDTLMSTKLLARAEKMSQYEQLRTLPRFRKAAGTVAAVARMLRDAAEADADLAAQAEADGMTVERVALAQVWAEVEQVASKDELTKALATVTELVPDADDDDEASLWGELVSRYATVRPFLESLATVIPWGATQTGVPILAALQALSGVLARRKPTVSDVAEEVVTGSWRRLVLGNRSWSRR